jgi:hypothetical protein
MEMSNYQIAHLSNEKMIFEFKEISLNNNYRIDSWRGWKTTNTDRSKIKKSLE